jgi:hypothetical protein
MPLWQHFVVALSPVPLEVTLHSSFRPIRSLRGSPLFGAAAAFALAAAAVTAPVARAQTFTFTDIANSLSSEFSTTFVAPSINDAGVVAFAANRDVGGSGVYKATSIASFTTVATSGSPEFSGFVNNFGTTTSINDAGVVAFFANRNVGGSGLYKATDAALGFTTVATTDSPEFNNFGLADLNEAGVVGFGAGQDDGGVGIYKATDIASGFTTVATDDSPEFSTFGTVASINDAGEVAFRASRDAGGTGVYKATDAASGFTAIVTPVTNPDVTGGFNIGTINNAGVVAFLAGQTRPFRIYTGADAASVSLIATTGGLSPFSGFGTPAVNDLGTVVFATDPTNPTNSIYAKLASSPDLVRVISAGDALFGSTVTSLGFFRGLADKSDLFAFQYTLASGVSGVAAANINSTAAPEPSALALLASVTMPLAGMVIRKRRSQKA